MVDIDPASLLSVARRTAGRPDAQLGTWRVEPAAHVVENMTTAELAHVHGTLADGTPWSVFAKALHPASCSPQWAFVPPEHQAPVLENLNWLDEPRVYRSALGADLPEGVRLPRVWQVDEGPERIVLWLEHVDDHATWDVEGHRRAGLALGRLAGRWPEGRAVAELGFARRSLAYLFFGKISHVDLPLLADDETWAAPHVAAAVDDDLRADLVWLADAVPALLGRMEALPHALAHGDAAPANLLGAADGSLVAIDWSYGAIGAVGSDLSQLVAGRYEDGSADPADLAAVTDAALDGFLAGLADEGAAADRREVELAWATHLAVRSAFSAVLVGQPGQLRAPGVELVRRRAALARFAVDLARRVAG